MARTPPVPAVRPQSSLQETDEEARERRLQQKEKRRLAALKAEQARNSNSNNIHRSPQRSTKTATTTTTSSSSTNNTPARVVRFPASPAAPSRWYSDPPANYSSSTHHPSQQDDPGEDLYDTMEVHDSYQPQQPAAHQTPPRQQQQPQAPMHTPAGFSFNTEQDYNHHIANKEHQQQPRPYHQTDAATAAAASAARCQWEERFVAEEHERRVVLHKKKGIWSLATVELRKIVDQLDWHLAYGENNTSMQLEAMDAKVNTFVSALLAITHDLNESKAINTTTVVEEKRKAMAPPMLDGIN